MHAALAEVNAASASLRRSMIELDNAHVGPGLGRTVNSLDESAKAIKQASDNIATASTALNKSVTRLDNIMEKIDSGRGTLGLLVNDSSLYVETNETMRQIRALAQDIRERPSRYIDLKLFGH
jgi:phospholipid/cholesterol/gamma-HCH transport system substrate-binding protein